jgi:hypothetical protein
MWRRRRSGLRARTWFKAKVTFHGVELVCAPPAGRDDRSVDGGRRCRVVLEQRAQSNVRVEAVDLPQLRAATAAPCQ